MASTETESAFDLDYLCRLSRLSLSEAERTAFSGQLDAILNYVRRLEGIDVSGVEPMAHGTLVYNVMDEDLAVEPMPRAGLLENAPDAEEGQIRVPRVIET